MQNAVAELDWVEAEPCSCRALLEEADRFTWVVVSHQVVIHRMKRKQKTRLIFTNLGHLWFRNDILLSIRRQVYTAAAMRSTPLQGSEMRAEDMRKLSVVKHCHLRSISRICCFQNFHRRLEDRPRWLANDMAKIYETVISELPRVVPIILLVGWINIIPFSCQLKAIGEAAQNGSQ